MQPLICSLAFPLENFFIFTIMYDKAYQLAETAQKEKLDLESTHEPSDASDELAATYRKVDWRVSALLCGVYFLQFIDKSLLNYAAVMGIKSYLKPKSNQFSDLGTILYVAYIVGEPVNAFLFQKLPAAKLLGGNIFCWGVVILGHAFAKNYASLMVVRALLGFFEACVAPGCILITGMWYNKTQQLKRTCWWTCQAGVSTIFGGLLSFAFQHVHGAGLASWQIFYLVMGIITIFFGALVVLVMPDSPMSAKFISDSEKIAILENIRQNQTGTETNEWKWDQVKEFFFHDSLTWLMLGLTLLLMIPTGAVLTFSVTMIANIGFSNQHAALMQMPLGVSTILAITIGTYLCAHFNGNHRNLIFISMLIPAIIGYIVLITSHNKIGQLLAVYLINVGTCVITMIYSWNSTNTAGYTKRVLRSCLTMVAFAVGALIGPQLFRQSDAPRYLHAKITLLVIECVCVPYMLLISWVSKKKNEKKENLDEASVKEWLAEKGSNYQFLDLTDQENIMFRYSY